MDVLVALLSGGCGLAVGAVLSQAWTRRSRTERAAVGARLDRIEHMLTAPDQAWYWTPEWQAGEAEADADLAAGRTTRYDSEDEFLAALDALPTDTDDVSRTRS